jgi:hypothetical protein
MLICILLPTLLYIWTVREPPPRWRAAYFGNERLEGVALVRAERDVNRGSNGRNLPEGIPADRFGVRWDTCLTLERARAVAFQLTSHDEARLLIDDQVVIDNLGQRPVPRTRGTDVSLDAGAHHLCVEYHQRAKPALLTLVASFDGQRPQRIAPERLRFPDGDSQHPCKAVLAP